MADPLTDWLTLGVYGNPVRDWFVAVAVGVLTLLVALLARRFLVRRLSQTAAQTVTAWDDFLLRLAETTRLVPLLVAAFAAGSLWLDLPAKPVRVIQALVVLALLAQAALWSTASIDFWVDRARRQRLETDAAAATTIVALRFVIKLVLYSVILLLALDNLGVDVTALVAGLGVGGVAVALATQNILGDLFASLSIVIDKPFVIGDFITVGDFLGSVEYIGLKTTRLRSLSGEQLIFGNHDLLQSRIRNYKRMAERRVVFAFGLVYQTPAAVLERVPAMVRKIIEGQEPVRFDRAHFKVFGDSAYEFEVVYYVLSADYTVYMDVQQAINLALLRRFEHEGIAFAYPTRTLFIEASGEPAAKDAAAALSTSA
jgi:small-conductance mechanosensitive channel